MSLVKWLKAERRIIIRTKYGYADLVVTTHSHIKLLNTLRRIP